MSPGVKPSSGSYEISEHRPPQSTQVMWDGIGIWRRYRHTGGVRVVSGTLGGRKVLVPEGETTRPTSERVREAIFNSLFSLDVIDGVESISYHETRNYVQRVMENIQVYRVRLGESQFAEGIVRDFKR